MTTTNSKESESRQFTAESIVEDYRIGWRSRHVSLLGRKETLTGKAKFGIFGDGKEVAQLALARAFRKGDWRSGYYRDQTLMFALGLSSVREYFAQLYAHADPEADPFSAGRQMNAHFSTRLVDEDGNWLPLANRYNISSDISPTAGQMPRLVGLAYASRLFRNTDELAELSELSSEGNEIAWGTIGNASCAEGLFWESINAAGVLRIPMFVSIWDDEYGISVPNEYQITKGDLSAVLGGFQRERGSKQGFDLYRVNGWDYPALCETYLSAAEIVRKEHVPAILHVTEVTQPQGHSTSGSHERYKSRERLEWEKEFDCLRKMREWMLSQNFADEATLDEIEKEEAEHVRAEQRAAWDAFREDIEKDRRDFLDLARRVGGETAGRVADEVERNRFAGKRDLQRSAAEIIFESPTGEVGDLREWFLEKREAGHEKFGAHLHAETGGALDVEPVAPEYDDDADTVNGFEVLNACFDAALARDPRISFMGEDVGFLGDVNQGCAGLQEKYGELRVTDTGIREATIIGQAIGMAMRGLRPVAEMQYLDYVLYGLQTMSDDLATVRWRSAGNQMAPAIIRTRGHRLEGVWHSGSPMGGIIDLVRGMWVCVPRNMTQAAGMYNTLFEAKDPALVVEVLNGYRLKERMPRNVGEMRVPLGKPEILREGSDVTIATYGPLCRIVSEAADLLARKGIEIELIDVQTLLPFDLDGTIAVSVKKTSRLIVVDEDVPGGASAFILRNVLDRDRAYEWLDSQPRALSASEHRPPYGSEGDYWAKPNREDVIKAVWELMREAKPSKYPSLW